MRQDISDRLVDHRSGDHQPDGSWLLKFFHHVGERRGANRLLLDQVTDRLRRPVEHYALMSMFDEPSNHVGAHPSQSNHCKLHRLSFLKTSVGCIPIVSVAGFSQKWIWRPLLEKPSS